MAGSAMVAAAFPKLTSALEGTVGRSALQSLRHGSLSRREGNL